MKNSYSNVQILVKYTNKTECSVENNCLKQLKNSRACTCLCMYEHRGDGRTRIGLSEVEKNLYCLLFIISISSLREYFEKQEYSF